MKNLKRTVLVLIFVGWSALIFDRGFTLGQHTRHNQLLWASVTGEYSFPTGLKTETERLKAYDSERDAFALGTEGDWALKRAPASISEH